MKAEKRRTPHLPRAVARDERLCRRDLGLVAELWSHRPGAWTFTVQELWEDTRNEDGSATVIEGRDALYKTVGRLRQVGYVVPVSDLTPHGWEVRYALNRGAAPRGGDGFVHVPWSVCRDRSMSYRQRGLLIQQLAEGTTVGGQTVAVHRGGLKALARRKPDGVDATTTDLDGLLLLGYAERERRRDQATGRLSWSLVFRSWAPVDNSECEEPAPTCEDGASPQVSPTTGFPGTIKGSSQGSSKGSNRGDRSVRSAHQGDAHACEAPSANDEDRPEKQTSASTTAWAVVNSLPSEMLANTTGKRFWVRREMAKAVQRMLDDGYRPGVIVRHADRLQLAADFDHLRVLAALRRDLGRLLYWGEICGDCGRNLPDQRVACPDCDPAARLDDDIDPDQLSRVMEHLGASA